MSKPKLLFLTYDQPNKLGGPIVNLQRILPRLNEHFNVYLLCFYKKNHPNASKIESEGVNVYFRKKSIIDIEYQEIFQLVKKLQPDVFIPDVSHAGWYFATGMKSMIPTVFHCRSFDLTNLDRFVLLQDTKDTNPLGIVAVSNFLMDKLINEKISHTNIVKSVIQSGVIIAEYTRNNSLDLDDVKIVYAGRVEKQQKRCDLLLQIIDDIDKTEKYSFQIIGNGSLVQSFQEIEGKVEVLGNKEGVKYKNALADNHFFIMLSDYEGMPGALLDAMSVGLVPIVNNFPGVDEVIEHGVNGFVIDNKTFSSEDLVKLVASIDISRYQELSENAYQTIVNRFSVDSSLNKWKLMVEELLKSNTTTFNINGIYYPRIRKDLAGQGSHIPISQGWIYWLRYVLASVKRGKNPLLPFFNS